MSNLREPRQAYKPFEYTTFNKYVQGIRNTYWVHDELDFTRDIKEFKNDLTDVERYIIGTILKTFAQTEVHVADEFWSRLYEYMPKPEIFRLSLTFSENEMRHADAYDKLNEELDLQDYAAFLEDEVAKERLDNLISIRKDHKGQPSVRDICRTLAVFGGFTENVNLFSQFAILKSFSANGRNLMPNIANIIDWSQQDEKTHALAALELFNILKEENPEIWDDEFKAEIYGAANITFKIEQHLIDQIFAQGELPNMSKTALLNFMKSRINQSLSLMGLKPIYNVDEKLTKEMSWFDDASRVLQHTDFFNSKPTEYTKNLVAYNSDTVKISMEELTNLIIK
jgi:ribonucleoside-diphosphate reductase beta chain